MMVKEYKQENSTLPTQTLCAAFGLARSSFYAGVKSLKKNFELDKIVWNKMVAPSKGQIIQSVKIRLSEREATALEVNFASTEVTK